MFWFTAPIRKTTLSIYEFLFQNNVAGSLPLIFAGETYFKGREGRMNGRQIFPNFQKKRTTSQKISYPKFLFHLMSIKEFLFCNFFGRTESAECVLISSRGHKKTS